MLHGKRIRAVRDDTIGPHLIIFCFSGEECRSTHDNLPIEQCMDRRVKRLISLQE